MRVRWLVGLALLVAGCGSGRAHSACAGGVAGPLVAAAAMFELDDYGAGHHCDGADVADATSAPVSTHSFAAGAPISVSLAPGAHTLVVRAFADGAATMPLGSGCVDAQLAAGGDFCFDVTLAPVDGGAGAGGGGGGGFGGDGGGGSGGGGGLGGGDMSCAVTHSDGLGDTFVDCVPLGTQDSTQAHKAADAWDATGTIDAQARSYSDSKGQIMYICDQSVARNACACWTWGGTGQYAGVGHAEASSGKPTQCFIPFSNAYPVWN